MERALFQMSRQTTPIEIVVVDDPPRSAHKDITWRFRLGMQRTADFDLTFVIEDDDWYAEDYVAKTVSAWELNGRPDIFGIGHSTYYHVGIRKWVKLDHPGRASAFTTCISKAGKSKCALGDDTDPFADIKMWQSVPGLTWNPPRPVAIGIKHGMGMGGGIGHNPMWAGYQNSDPEMSLLESWIGEDVEFYKRKIST